MRDLPVRVIRGARPRCKSSSLAFSLRELEIELYTLTQPSGYAIRRNPRRVDIYDITASE